MWHCGGCFTIFKYLCQYGITFNCLIPLKCSYTYACGTVAASTGCLIKYLCQVCKGAIIFCFVLFCFVLFFRMGWSQIYKKSASIKLLATPLFRQQKLYYPPPPITDTPYPLNRLKLNRNQSFWNYVTIKQCFSKIEFDCRIVFVCRKSDMRFSKYARF